MKNVIDAYKDGTKHSGKNLYLAIHTLYFSKVHCIQTALLFFFLLSYITTRGQS
jgi:hypothetical protein